MADATRRAQLIIEAKDAVTGEAGKAGKALGGLKSSLSSLNQEAGMLVKSFIGPAALIGALKGSIDAAMEAQRVMTQTEAVIKSTGGAAGLTAQEIEKMAGAESRLTSIDDEVIQSGQNMLLTFTNIGGEVFPRATRAMEDMAVAFAKGDTSAIDLQGTAIQLGKALQDPERGLLALRRVGVAFTESQKAAIKQMMAMNDVAGAQALILAELEREFGGSAEAAGTTLAGKLQKAQNAIENLGEAIGNKLIPILGDAADGLTTLITWNDRLNAVLTDHEKEVLKTSKTYEAYITEMNRAAAVTGLQVDANGDLVRAGQGVVGAYTQLVQANFALTEAEFETRNETNEAERAMARMGTSMKETAQSAEDLAMSNELASEEIANLRDLMAGTVGNEMKDYYEGQDENREKVAELRIELEKLEAAHGQVVTAQSKNTMSAAELNLAQIKLAEAQQKLSEATDPKKQAELAVTVEHLTEKIGGASEATTRYVDNSKKIGEIERNILDLNIAYSENATAHEDATKRILFDITAQQLAMSDLSKGDQAKALTELANRWGLIDQSTYTATQSILSATEQLATDENVDAFIDKLDNINLVMNDKSFPSVQAMIQAYSDYHANLIPATMETANLGGAMEDAKPKSDNLAGGLGGAAGGAMALMGAARDAANAVNSIPNEKTVIITTIQRTIEETVARIPIVPPIGRRQFGGTISGGAPYLVGEGGPELFTPASNGFVMDNADTRKMLSLLQTIASSIGGMGNVTVNAGAGTDTQSILNAIDVGLGRRSRLTRASGATVMGT